MSRTQMIAPAAPKTDSWSKSGEKRGIFDGNSADSNFTKDLPTVSVRESQGNETGNSLHRSRFNLRGRIQVKRFCWRELFEDDFLDRRLTAPAIDVSRIESNAKFPTPGCTVSFP